MKQYVPIADMLWFQEGPGVRNTQYTSTGVKLLNVANLVDGILDTTNTDRYISEDEAYGRYRHFLVDDGDLIIASSGIKVEYFDKKMGFANKEQLPLCMNTSTIRFKVLNKEQVSIRYFMYYLKSEHFKEQLNHQITGSAQLNFGPSHLKKMLFPIVEMAMQQQIVGKLDVLHSIENRLRQELSLLDQLVKSRFIELFGRTPDEEMVSMAEICRIITDGTHQPPQFVDKGIPFLFVSNIVTNKICYETERFITEETYTELIKRTPIEIGDVLLSTVGSYGHPAVVKRDKRFCFQRHIAYLKPDSERVDSEYLRGAILSPDVQRQIDDRVKGIAQKTLNLSEIRKIKLPLPPMELQEQFAAFVEQTDKSKLAVQKALEQLETLKKSLMQQYFG